MSLGTCQVGKICSARSLGSAACVPRQPGCWPWHPKMTKIRRWTNCGPFKEVTRCGQLESTCHKPAVFSVAVSARIGVGWLTMILQDSLRALNGFNFHFGQANKRCADCPERGPTYVCLGLVTYILFYRPVRRPVDQLTNCKGLDFQIFVCQSCGGLHRECRSQLNSGLQQVGSASCKPGIASSTKTLRVCIMCNL